MTVLGEMQFELLPTQDAFEGFPFGIGLPVSVDDEGFDPGETSWLNQDGQNTRRGTRTFGRDVLNGPTWGFDLHVNTERTREAVETLEEAATAWRARQVRKTPGAVTALRYCLAGRNRRVYGRPGRFSAPPSNRILGGYVPITADFGCSDGLSYDDVASTAFLDLSRGTGGGFVLPAVFPLSTLPPSTTSVSQVAIGGTEDTNPWIRFMGPWQDPSLITDRWTLALRGTIDAGDYVDVDARPWAMSITKNGSTAGVAGLVSRRTYLEDIFFSPGTATLSLGGTSPLGGAGCIVSWRAAWNSY